MTDWFVDLLLILMLCLCVYLFREDIRRWKR